MKALVLTNEMVNEVAKSVYGEGAIVTFLEEMEMDAVVVYDGDKINQIIELEDALFDFGKVFNQSFTSYEAVEIGELGFGYAFTVERVSLTTTSRSCA